MSNPVTPIKRSPELAPLSREHHEGLLFVFKIRQGLKLGISGERMAGFCAWNWAHHFSPHFQKEEELLVPALGADHTLIWQMMAEHKALSEMFLGITHQSDASCFERLVKSLNDHIRFEERVLFPEIERNSNPEQMAAMAEVLAQTDPSCALWEDEFWVAAKK